MADRPRRAVDDESLAETNIRPFDPADLQDAGADEPSTPDTSASSTSASSTSASSTSTPADPPAEDPNEQTMLRDGTASDASFDPEDDTVDYAGDDLDDEPEHNGRRIVGWVIVIILALIAATGAFVVARNAFGPADQAIKPDRMVEEYLQAVAAGDAEKVLSYGPPAPPDSPLLTNELLAASNNRAPLTDISVVASNDVQVQVEYQRGGQPVTGIFDVSKYNGRWILQTWGVLQVSENDLRMPFLLDGVPLPGPGAYPVFPGNYMVTSSTDAIEIDSTLTVPDNASDRPLGQVPLTLTEAGRRDARTLISAELERCFDSMNSGDLTPNNCPIEISPEVDGDGKVIPESVNVTVENDPLHAVEVSVVEGSPIALADLTIEYTITGQAERGGEKLDIIPRTQTAETTATVAFDQEPPTVGWTRR